MVTEKHAKESNPTEPNLTQGANLTLIQFFGQPSFFLGGGGGWKISNHIIMNSYQ